MEIKEHQYARRLRDPVGSGCKVCKLTPEEHEQAWPNSVFDREKFHDFVVAHGVGEPTEQGYIVGEDLIATGDDYATAAFEVVFRNLTTEGDSS